MTNRITTPPEARTVIVGVDTHKHVHVAVAIDSWGIRLGDHAFVVDSGGYEALVTWAETHGRIEAFRDRRHRELRRWPGTGRPPSRASCRGSESGRPPYTPRRRHVRHHRTPRWRRGPCSRGSRRPSPRPRTGAVEMIRQLKITRDTAMKARTTAMNTLKQIIVAGPARPAEKPSTTSPITACSRRCAGPPTGPHRHAHRVRQAHPPVARPVGGWLSPRKSRALHDQHLARLTTATSPTLCEGFGVGRPTPRLSC